MYRFVYLLAFCLFVILIILVITQDTSRIEEKKLLMKSATRPNDVINVRTSSGYRVLSVYEYRYGERSYLLFYDEEELYVLPKLEKE